MGMKILPGETKQLSAKLNAYGTRRGGRSCPPHPSAEQQLPPRASVPAGRPGERAREECCHIAKGKTKLKKRATTKVEKFDHDHLV